MVSRAMLQSALMAAAMVAGSRPATVTFKVKSVDGAVVPKVTYTDGPIKLGKGGKRRQRKERGW